MQGLDAGVLSERVAVRLLVPESRESDRSLGMATLVTPTLALTSLYHPSPIATNPTATDGPRQQASQRREARLRKDVIAESGASEVLALRPSLVVEFLIPRLPSPNGGMASVAEVDSDLGFAVLAIQPPVAVDLPPDLLDASVPTSGQVWNALVYSPSAPDGERASGTVIDALPGRGIGGIRLRVERQPSDSRGVAGAPLIIDDRIVGLVADVKGDDEWWAIPVAAMAESKATSAVRDALALDRPPVAQTAEPATPVSEKDVYPDLDEAAFFERLSPSSQSALEHAEAIRAHLNGDKVHMEHLIAGLYYGKEAGPTRAAFAAVQPPIDGTELTSIVERATETVLPQPGSYSVGDLSALPSLSSHVREAISIAQHVADESGSSRIRSRHLLYGALSVESCDVIKELLGRGLDRNAISLRDADEQTSGRGSAIAGYRTDLDLDGEDRLDITREVGALCSVIAAKDVPLPMAIGLFGPWGSGKSFFMQKMEKQIEEIKREETKRQSDAPDRETQYSPHIVQLKFNAWHYMDTNLWASLNTELFEGLAWALKPEGTDAVDTPAQLRAQSAAATGKLAEAERARVESEAQLREVDSKLERAQTDLSPMAMARGTYGAALSRPEVKEKAERVAEALDLRATRAAAEEVGAQLLELRGLWGRAQVIALSIRKTRARWKWLVALIAVLLTPVLLGVIAPFLSGLGLDLAMSRLAGLLLGVAGALAPFAADVRRGLAQVQDFVDEVEKAREDEISKLRERREELVGEVEKKQKAVQAASQELSQLQERIDGLGADRQMARWVEQRLASHDYSRYLGVVAKARDDFEQLANHLKAVRDQPRSDQKTDDTVPRLPRIDRIVLYIDDLDRCPERVVEEVLQAVHLLLAFPVFVVVVAVDPRWLLHALRRRSPAFQDSPRTTRGMSEAERRHWLSTPLNYLEKIFQIPFTLRPLESTGYEKMVDDLVKQPSETANGLARGTAPQGGQVAPGGSSGGAPGSNGAANGATAGRQAADDSSQAVRQNDSSVATAPEVVSAAGSPGGGDSVGEPDPGGTRPPIPPPAPIDLNPSYLSIGSQESAFMKALYPLIPSPRAAKRFVNVYRLLKAMYEPGSPDSFRDDAGQSAYRIVLLLLAIQTGYPAEAAGIFRSLVGLSQLDRPWWQFVDEVNGRASGSQQASVGDDLGTHWPDLYKDLQQIRNLIPAEQTCADFMVWAPRVARFSFHSGQALFTL